MRTTGTRQRFAAVLGAAALALGLAAVTQPATAAAAPAGHIYGVTPAWGGWQCTGKFNRVAWVGYANHTTGRNGGDAGDDIVYIPVSLNVNNHVTMTIRCSLGTHLAQNFVIKPTRNNQTFWFRLNGTSTKN